MTSAPPPPSMVSLPEPVVMVLAAEEPGDGQRRGRDRRVEILEIGNDGGIADGLVGARSNGEIDRP